MKYANTPTRHYQLQLWAAGTLKASLSTRSLQALTPIWREIMPLLSDISYNHYRTLLERDGFVPFFRQATPIDIIEQSRIGSRPAKRTGQSTLADLRAIPWLFSWSQSRFMLSAWYGFGTALERLQQDAQLWATIRQEETRIPVMRYLLTHVSTSLLQASEFHMNQYASLVEDNTIRDRFLPDILEEYHRTRRMVEAVYGQPLGDRKGKLQALLQSRDPYLRQLHHYQTDLLQQYRQTPPEDTEQRAYLLELHLHLLSAIAGGLNVTG